MTTRRIRTAALALTVAVAATVSGAALSAPAATNDRERRSASSPARILYSSDWAGMRQVYAVDPSGRLPTGQLTSARPPRPDCTPEVPCGWGGGLPSPDGSRVLLWDEVEQGALNSTLCLARADGSGRRAVAKARPALYWAPVWSPDSTRFAFTDDTGLWVAGGGSGAARRVFEGDVGRVVAWSPDGRSLAFVVGRQLMALRDGRARVVFDPSANTTVEAFAWSPDSTRVAYADLSAVGVVRADGTRRQRLLRSGAHSLAWSPRSDVLAVDQAGVEDRPLVLVSLGTAASHSVDPLGMRPSWSPDGRFIAYTRSPSLGSGPSVELVVYDVARRRARVLDRGVRIEQVSWAPAGARLAYVRGLAAGGLVSGAPGDVRITDTAGRASTVIAAAGRYGGLIQAATWARPPASTMSRKPTERRVAEAGRAQVIAPWGIQRLVTSGNRAVYVACGHMFSWTPGASTVVQVDPVASLRPECASPRYSTSFSVYTLALAGERVVYGQSTGGNDRRWWLAAKPLDAAATVSTLGTGRSTGGGGPARVVGEAVGSGDLAVFSSWDEELGPSGLLVRRQEIHRVGADGSDAGVIAAEPGPFVPLDVDAGRIVAAGDNAVVLLAGDGTRLLTVPVHAAGAALSGDDLALLVPGAIAHVDARTGAELHRWRVPGLAVGRRCADPRSTCKPGQLVLDDVARGLAVYVAGTDIHLLRLADGADRVVATGTLAHFTDTGLVHANGTRLTLVPFARLPLGGTG